MCALSVVFFVLLVLIIIIVIIADYCKIYVNLFVMFFMCLF